MVGLDGLKRWGGLAGAGLTLAGCSFGGDEPSADAAVTASAPRIASETPSRLPDQNTGADGLADSSPEALESTKAPSNTVDIALNQLIKDGNDALSLYLAVDADMTFKVKKIDPNSSSVIKLQFPKSMDFQRPEGREIAPLSIPESDVARKFMSETRRLKTEIDSAACGIEASYSRLSSEQKTTALLAVGSWSLVSENAAIALRRMNSEEHSFFKDSDKKDPYLREL